MLETRFCGIECTNPTVLASGILGLTKSSLQRIARQGAGALTIKSVSVEERKGHTTPVVQTFEAGLINAVGYSNPGWEKAKEEFSTLAQETQGVPIFASIVGKDVDEFVYLAEHFLKGSTNSCPNFSAVEISLSCPHTPGFGMLSGQGSPEASFEITQAVCAHTNLPVIVKLSPNIAALSEVGNAVKEAGASALNMGNTHGPGMLINIETASPVLGFTFGGISGKAVRPATLRCVYDLYASVKLPIIGTGGISNWRDAVEMIMAGASLVGVGSAIYDQGITVFSKITAGIKTFMSEHSYASVAEMIGKAHW